MNWEGFDPVKAVKDAQRKIELLLERNAEYYQFITIDRFKAVQDFIDKPEIELSDLNDSGMMFIIQLMMIDLNASVLSLDAFLLTVDAEEVAKIKPKVDDLKQKIVEVKQKLADRREAEEDPKKWVRYTKWEGTNTPLEAQPKDEVFGLISDLLECSAPKDAVMVPDSVRERYVPFDHAAIEKKVLGSPGLTVKQIGSGLKTAETPSLGIAVTFQACLQLENDGRVVLSQVEGDVSVSPSER